MSETLLSLDLFIRGIACGGLAAIAISALRSPISCRVRWALALWAPSTVAWLMTESAATWHLFNNAYVLIVLAYPVAGLFWMFVSALFDDAPLDAVRWSPTIILMVSGIGGGLIDARHVTELWTARNLFSLALNLHAAFLILRGSRNDLLEARRRLRGPLLGFAVLFVAFEVAAGLAQRVWPGGDLHLWFTGEIYGGAIMAVLTLIGAAVFIQARPEVFGVSRRPAPPIAPSASTATEVRSEVVDQTLLDTLQTLMATEAWRRDGLTIGRLAADVGVPEHQLRRLINQRLGYRNFTDFMNGYRIEAAKQRLADPAEARTTIAAVAFDVGYGSLGPFNRAFRLATGMSPTAWREAALKDSPKMKDPG